MNYIIHVYNMAHSYGISDRYNNLLTTNLKKLIESADHCVMVKEHTSDSDSYSNNKISANKILSNFDINISNKKILCDDFLIIENIDTHKFLLINIQDGTDPLSILCNINGFSGSIETFYDQQFISQYFKNTHLIIPGFYFPMFPNLIKEYKDEIDKIKRIDNRMFFAGTIGYETEYLKSDGQPRRQIVMILKEKYPDCIRILDRNQKLDRVEWWRESAKHYINLAIPGHPWCNREFELWGLGLTILASFWKNPMMINPIPNYHYISAAGGDREHTGVCIDAEYAADEMYKKYIECISDKEYLKWIGDNGNKFYNNNLTIEHIANNYCKKILNWVPLNNK